MPGIPLDKLYRDRFLSHGFAHWKSTIPYFTKPSVVSWFLLDISGCNSYEMYKNDHHFDLPKILGNFLRISWLMENPDPGTVNCMWKSTQNMLKYLPNRSRILKVYKVFRGFSAHFSGKYSEQVLTNFYTIRKYEGLSWKTVKTNGSVQRFLHCCSIVLSVLFIDGPSSVRRLPIITDFPRVQRNGPSALQSSSWVCLLHSSET